MTDKVAKAVISVNLGLGVQMPNAFFVTHHVKLDDQKFIKELVKLKSLQKLIDKHYPEKKIFELKEEIKWE